MSTLLCDLHTPCLILDRGRLKANAARMLDKARRHSLALRPHVKTTKSADVARLAHDGDRGPLTVSTLKEAEYFAGHGFRDITYAVALTPNKFSRAAALADSGVALKVLVSSVDMASAIAGFTRRRSVPLDVLLEIDSGEHRTGFLPTDDSLVEAANAINGSRGCNLKGLLTHGGHSYGGRSPADFARVAEDERRSLLTARDSLQDAVDAELVLSSGSTPTAVFGEDFAGIHEIRPGVYLAGDLFQAQLGTISVEDIAVSVLASVIAHDRSRNTLMLDAGGLALSKDRSTASARVDQGYGIVVRADGSRFDTDPLVSNVHQEHGEVTGDTALPYDELPVGSMVRVLPNHVCMTAAPHDRYLVVEGVGNEVVAVWDKVTGW